ncbi:MAG: hypothetical protein V8Q23_06310 [Eubacteriales bacterium]
MDAHCGRRARHFGRSLRTSSRVFYETLTNALSKVQNETERDTLAMTNCLATKEVRDSLGVALKADDGDADMKWNEAVKSAASAEDFFNLALQDTLDGANARQKLIS